MSETWLAERLLTLIPLVLSLTVHEWAHAFAAWRLGDDTALRQGRLTLDPFAHVDPVGTLLLPMLGVPFGWAKPVPINPLRFTVSERLGVMLTAAAGPASNAVLALACGAATYAGAAVGLPAAIHSVLWSTTLLNVALALFNLLPIPPLDGSRVVDWLMPDSLRPLWDRVQALGPLALAVVVVLPALLGGYLLLGSVLLGSLYGD